LNGRASNPMATPGCRSRLVSGTAAAPAPRCKRSIFASGNEVGRTVSFVLRCCISPLRLRAKEGKRRRKKSACDVTITTSSRLARATLRGQDCSAVVPFSPGGDSMLSIKAIAAIALAGLGSATMGTDVYMASHTKAPSKEFVIELSAPVRAEPAPLVAPAPAPDPVLMLSPVTIYAHDRSRHAARQASPTEAPKEQGLVACSDWRSLENGPEGRGVRTLCTPPPASP
jgi:hypothetical protein